MPRQANGQYLPPANTTAITATTISSTAYNTLETDIGLEITNSLDRLGRSAMQAALPMGSNKITGMADPTVSTDAATKAYVDALVASFFSTGDLKPTLKTTADTGWVMFDDGTIGSASSGASSRANADTQPLFNLLFNAVTDANAAILTSGGGATTRAAQVSASAAWAANCRMSLPKALGRAIGVAGSGAGLSSWALAQAFGDQANIIAQGNLPAVSYNLTGTGATITVTSNRSDVAVITAGWQPMNSGGSPGYAAAIAGTGFTTAITSTGSYTPAGTVGPLGSGTAINNIQPTTFFNMMVKL